MKIYASGSKKNGLDLVLTEKFAVNAPEKNLLKANPNAYHKAKLTTLEKKVAQSQHRENAEKIQIQNAKAQRKMSELDDLKRLAGITEFRGYRPYDASNISVTGNEKAELMMKHNIKPGTPEWFQLWFALPYMTGERFGDRKWLR